MINTETIKFMKTLDTLASLLKNGIEPFQNATEDSFDTKIFYDQRTQLGFSDDEDTNAENLYKVVWDAFIDDASGHHDIICYCDDEDLDYEVRAFVSSDRSYIIVKLLRSDEYIEISNGEWNFIY